MVSTTGRWPSSMNIMKDIMVVLQQCRNFFKLESMVGQWWIPSLEPSLFQAHRPVQRVCLHKFLLQHKLLLREEESDADNNVRATLPIKFLHQREICRDRWLISWRRNWVAAVGFTSWLLMYRNYVQYCAFRTCGRGCVAFLSLVTGIRWRL